MYESSSLYLKIDPYITSLSYVRKYTEIQKKKMYTHMCVYVHTNSCENLYFRVE